MSSPITVQAWQLHLDRTQICYFRFIADTREGKPYTAIIDGPNVAYFGWGKVNIFQLQRMVDELEEQGEHPLVVMPEKYTRPRFYLRAGTVRHLLDIFLHTVKSVCSSVTIFLDRPNS